MFTNLQNKKKQKKGNKNNSYCGSVQRSSLLPVKSASLLAANPSITDQNRSASSDYNAIPIYPFIKAVSGIPLQQTTNVCFFTQKNKNNQWQVNLLYFSSAKSAPVTSEVETPLFICSNACIASLKKIKIEKKFHPTGPLFCFVLLQKLHAASCIPSKFSFKIYLSCSRACLNLGKLTLNLKNSRPVSCISSWCFLKCMSTLPGAHQYSFKYTCTRTKNLATFLVFWKHPSK